MSFHIYDFFRAEYFELLTMERLSQSVGGAARLNHQTEQSGDDDTHFYRRKQVHAKHFLMCQLQQIV